MLTNQAFCANDEATVCDTDLLCSVWYVIAYTTYNEVMIGRQIDEHPCENLTGTTLRRLLPFRYDTACSVGVISQNTISAF